MHDIQGFRGGQQTDAGPVAKEAQVAVIRDDQDGAVPRCLRCGGGAGPDVVHCADVAAGETETGAGSVHGFVGRVEWWGEGKVQRGG